MERTAAPGIPKLLILAAAIAFVYWSVLARLGSFWWEDPNYSHGLLIPFVIAYILWMERDTLARTPSRPALWWGGAATLCALLALWVGTAGAEQFLQRMSFVLLLAGAAVYLHGFALLRKLLVPLLLLALTIPIPSIIFNKIAFPLQLFASRCAVWAMRMFEIPVLRAGNVIELKPLGSTITRKLEVVEACSGIRSLMTLVTLAVVYAYFTHPEPPRGASDEERARVARFGIWRAIILVLAAVPIAIITNAGRVSGTGILSHYYGTEVADGFFHSFSGWVVYVVAFLLLFGFGWLIDRFSPARRIRNERKRRESAPPTVAVPAADTVDAVTPDARINAEANRGAQPIGGAAPAAISVPGGEGSSEVSV